jgi:hypothetical protein
MGWIGVIVDVLIKILKGIFGTDKPRKETVERPEPEVEVTDGKTDKDRLRDLGL